uniref:Family with sequence similarity 24 member A n=1 Tax=Loxodonta africana TaxID=9785 RepID=G3UGA3_LOXAF
NCETFDLKTIIIISIGGCILVAVLVVIILIICVYAKLANSTKAAKTCAAGPLKKNNSAVDSQAKSVTAASSATLQLCEECSMYAAYDPLPPCFCDTNEGL